MPEDLVNDGPLGDEPAPGLELAVTRPPRVDVVGIGASAGGIEALGQFFEAMPPDSGCAFVVVLHLHPSHQSELAHVVSLRTAMTVVQIKDGMEIEVNHVYVIAPNTDVEVRGGYLHVSEPTKSRSQRHPVDVLFNSIAHDQHERGIAIVLSGTGSNGTVGLKEIRAEGGMSIAQSPKSATFDGMPRSAIAAGMVDHVALPEEMPQIIMAYVRHDYVSSPAGAQGISTLGETNFTQVINLLRISGGHDFRSYKDSTLRRRIHRRLGLRNIATLEEYLDELRSNPDEIRTLTGDLMISVTNFFRDTEAWNALAELVIAPMVAELETDASVRVWVPACSTGEEAYTVAMLITEMAEAAKKSFDVKVFATDAQETNLMKARDGIYPRAAVADSRPRASGAFSRSETNPGKLPRRCGTRSYLLRKT